MWFGKEIQEMLRKRDGELNTLWLCSEFPKPRSAINWVYEVAVMKSRCGYKGYVIEARLSELKEGGFSAEFSIEEHDGSGVTETQFYLPSTFPTQESAFEAAIQAGRRKIDAGFERGSENLRGRIVLVLHGEPVAWAIPATSAKSKLRGLRRFNDLRAVWLVRR